MKNASRERRKAERAALTGEVEVLELQLERLRHRATGSARLMQSRVVVSPQEDSYSSPRWKTLALGEYSKRQLAVYTNQQLQRAHRRQQHTIKRLLEALRKAGLRVDSAVPAQRLHDAQGRRFAILSRELKLAYGELDRVFAAQTNGIRSNDEFMTRLAQSVSRQQPPELVLETRLASVIPVDLERCGRAYWRAGEQLARSTRVDVCISRPHEHEVRMRLHAATQQSAWLTTSSVLIQRFVEPGRIAIVWRSVTSINNDLELVDVYVEQVGWTLFEPAPAGTDASLADSVVLRDCMHTVPRSTRLDASRGIHPLAKAFTRLVVEATTSHMAAIKELMENALIEECMSGTE